jgi:cell cycle checkpoint control protein RAD9A
MVVVSFSLTPEATAKVYELLVCLAKFGEYVAIEARREKV